MRVIQLSQNINFLPVGVREWAEVIGIMTDKENQSDEEVLIYAMTLINKVFKLCYIYCTCNCFLVAL